MGSIVTNNGAANLSAALVVYPNRPRFLQWGEGSGQTVSSTAINDPGDTTEARTDGAASQQTTLSTNDTFRVSGTITALGPRAITEIGVFDVAGSGSPPTGGVMMIYGSFPVVNLSKDDAMTFIIDSTFPSA